MPALGGRARLIRGSAPISDVEQIVDITIEDTLVFDDPQANLMHGSVFVDPYYIGTPRGAIAAGLEDVNRIVRVHKDDLSTYSTIRLDDPRPGVTASFRSMEGLCYEPTRGKVYTIGYSGHFQVTSIIGYVIEVTPDPFSAILLAEIPISELGFVDAVVTDGDFLYYTENTAIHKFSLDTLTVVESVSLVGVVPSPHTMILSQYDGMLYVTSHLGAGDNAKMARYNPANLSAGALASVQVPGTTDDSAESEEFIFGGIELQNPLHFGYDFGAYAVRRSDFAFFSLPRLGPGDIAGIATWFVGVFDNRWLFTLKNNRKLYVIDLHAHPPDTWSQASDVSEVVHLIATFQEADLADWTDGAGNILTPLELALVDDNSGRFMSFGWPGTASNPLRRSGVIQYRLPTF